MAGSDWGSFFQDMMQGTIKTAAAYNIAQHSQNSGLQMTEGGGFVPLPSQTQQPIQPTAQPNGSAPLRFFYKPNGKINPLMVSAAALAAVLILKR